MNKVCLKIFRWLLGVSALFIFLGCDNQEFAGAGVTEGGPSNGGDNSTRTSDQQQRVDQQGSDITVDSSGQIGGNLNGDSGYDGIPEVPGDIVQKVGIHFEDGSDRDFNDLSACFEGAFKVNDRAIVSMKDQTVTVTFKRISAADHTFLFRVLNATGGELQVVTKALQRNEQVNYQINFPVRSKLFVQTTVKGRTVYDINHASMAMVEKDVCRSTGI